MPLIMGMGIPGLTVGAPGAAAAEGVLSKALPKAGPLITRGARALGEGLSQTLGWTAGRTAETGQVKPWGDWHRSRLQRRGWWHPGRTRSPGQAILRRSQAGKAIVAADEATTAARQTWETKSPRPKQSCRPGRTEAYQAAERRAWLHKRSTRPKCRPAMPRLPPISRVSGCLTAQRAEARRSRRSSTASHARGRWKRRPRPGPPATVPAGRHGQQQAITTARASQASTAPDALMGAVREVWGCGEGCRGRSDASQSRAGGGTGQPGHLARWQHTALPAGRREHRKQPGESHGETSFKTIREELRRLGPLTKSAGWQRARSRQAALRHLRRCAGSLAYCQ